MRTESRIATMGLPHLLLNTAADAVFVAEMAERGAACLGLLKHEGEGEGVVIEVPILVVSLGVHGEDELGQLAAVVEERHARHCLQEARQPGRFV